MPSCSDSGTQHTRVIAKVRRNLDGGELATVRTGTAIVPLPSRCEHQRPQFDYKCCFTKSLTNCKYSRKVWGFTD